MCKRTRLCRCPSEPCSMKLWLIACASTHVGSGILETVPPSKPCFIHYTCKRKPLCHGSVENHGSWNLETSFQSQETNLQTMPAGLFHRSRTSVSPTAILELPPSQIGRPGHRHADEPQSRGPGPSPSDHEDPKSHGGVDRLVRGCEGTREGDALGSPD